MSNCKLCLKKDADETGSHLIPHFLLKRVVNVQGKTDRDQEVAFTIDATNSSSSFGRSVNTFKLEEIYGELSDDDITKNIDQNVADHLLCKRCEKRLAAIESRYSKSLKKSSNTTYESGSYGLHGLLFWSCIFWRMSVSRRYGQFLSDDQEEILRKLLDDKLSVDISETPKYLSTIEAKYYNVTYKVLRAPNYSKDNLTHILFHPDFFSPYSTLIDEFLVTLSFDRKFSDYKDHDFFGIKEEVVLAPLNTGEENERISIIEEKVFEATCKRIIDKMKSLRASFIDEILNEIAKDLGYGEVMPEELAKVIYEQITSDSKPLGRKYTFDDIKESIIAVLKQNPPRKVK